MPRTQVLLGKLLTGSLQVLKYMTQGASKFVGQFVAVKKLKEDSPENTRKRLEWESQILKRFGEEQQHTNLMCSIGYDPIKVCGRPLTIGLLRARARTLP